MPSSSSVNEEDVNYPVDHGPACRRRRPDAQSLLWPCRAVDLLIVEDNQFSLFDLDPEEPQQAPAVEKPISADQITQLKQAFAAHGFIDSLVQEEIVRSCVIRPISSPEHLLSRDVRPILRRIEERAASRGPSTGSDWDNRQEDTWIDKL